MRIAIRVDASSEIGTGHFMRCLTLADALQQRGAQTRFVSRHMPEHLRNMLAQKGHEFIPLNSKRTETISENLSHASWLGTSQHADAQDTVQALSGQTWDWLVVDHYALAACWESVLRQITQNILVIDDIADRQHDCDVLLDQNFYADINTRYIGKVPPHCQFLLGPRYALLREEFSQARELAKPRSGPVKRILIFFGGVDANNYTGRAIEALVNLGIPDLPVDVVIGSQHPCREHLETQCARQGFTAHIQTSRMAELMAGADLAIGAGGSTTWERCCLGLPSLVISTVDNQHQQIADAACEGLVYAPELEIEFIPRLSIHVSALMGNAYLRNAISEKGLRAVDGRGVSRVAENLGYTEIEIRIATLNDAMQLFEWRNHPNIRAASCNPSLIEWESHQRWLASVLSAPERMLLIGQRKGIPVGVVRFDIQGDEAEVSIYLVPGNNHKGQGRALLHSAECWFISNRASVSKIRARVLGENERSRRLFLEAGYQVESASYSKRFH